MFSTTLAPLQSLWRWLTEPAASIVEPEARHRARAVASTLVLTLVLVLIPLLQRLINGDLPVFLLMILVITSVAYGIWRMGYTQIAGIIAILALWVLPMFAVMIGYSSTTSFILTVVRLLLLGLLFTYLLFSLRASLLLAGLMVIGFLLIPSYVRLPMSQTQLASDFLLTAAAIFFVFIITRHYDITERQNALVTQRMVEERYRAVVEVQTELVSRWLPDTTLTFVNETYCRFLNRTREELIGTRFGDGLAPEDMRAITEAIARITPEQPSVTYEHRVALPSGEVTWQQWTDHAIYDEHGQIIEYQSVGHDITQRKFAEEALAASEERYRAIVEIQTELICRWLPDHTITFVNQACQRYINLPRHEIIGSKILTTVHPEDLERVVGLIATISREQPTVTYEHRAINRAGELRWHQWTDQAIFDSAGQVLEYQSVGRDITDLKRAEEAERNEHEFVQALSSTAALLSSTLDLDEVLDRILNQVGMVNPLSTAEVILIDGSYAYVARSRGPDNAVYIRAVLRQRYPLESATNFKKMIATGLPVMIADVLDYPGWIAVDAAPWIRAAVAAPIRLEGETIGFLSVTSDKVGAFNDQHAARLQAFADQAAIAIRNARLYDEVRRHAGELEGLVRQRTAELELAHQRLRVILDGTGEGILYTENRTIQYVNLTFCKLTGYTSEELVGQDYEFVYGQSGNEADGLAALRQTMQNNLVWRGELPVRRKNGTLFDGGLTIALIGDLRQSPLRSVTVLRDVSQEKALQMQQSNLVAFASHELRTPITNLKTRLYLLRKRPQYLDDHLLVLDEVTERMRQLVEDLLDISRLEHGLIPLRRQPLNVQEVIHTVVTLQEPEAQRKQLDLHWEQPDEPIFVSADRERLIQVITNLVTNAINYTPSGGTVIVVVNQEDDSAQIAVEDTGIGIAPENLPYIFQPFYRVVSEVEGTGLGLSIAKEIVEMHEGKLDVRSEPGQGSVFKITLPLLKPMQVK